MFLHQCGDCGERWYIGNPRTCKCPDETPQSTKQEPAESWEELHNALQRIDTAAVGLPTFEVRHEGGLDAVVQNIVDAIVALHERPTPQRTEPIQSLQCFHCQVTIETLNDKVMHLLAERKPLTDEEAFKLVEQDNRMEEYAEAAVRLIRRTEAAHGIKE